MMNPIGMKINREIPVDPDLSGWRKRAMTIILIVVAVTSFPAFVSVAVNASTIGGISFLEGTYMAVYLGMILLAFFTFLDFRIRAWGLMVLCYTIASASFLRLGLTGSGRIWLVVMPVIATIILGTRPGYALGVFSLVLYVVFFILADIGVLGRFIVLHENPLSTGYWAEGGAALIVFLSTVVLLVERFVSLQKRTLDRAIEANRRLEETTSALRERESMLRTIGDNLPGGMIYQLTVHPDGARRFTYVSAGVEQLHGVKPDEVMADPSRLYGLLNKEDAARMMEEEEKTRLDLRAFDIEVRFSGGSGETQWRRIISQPRITEGGVIVADGMEIDITSRKTAEMEILRKNEELESANEELQATSEELETTNEALRESETRYRLISENTGDMIWMIDLDKMRFAYVSPSVKWLLGYTVEEMMNLSMDRTVDADSYKFITENLPLRIARVEAGDESVRVETHEIRQIRKEGTIVFAEVVSTLIQDENGRVNRLIGASRDIAKRKEAEEALRKSESKYRELSVELERKVELRTRELKDAYDDIKKTNTDLEKALKELGDTQYQLIQSEKLAALGQLAAGIAHELNTPLGAIISSNRSMIDIMNRKISEAASILSGFNKKELNSFQILLDASFNDASSIGSVSDRKIKKEMEDLIEKAGIQNSGNLAKLIMDSGLYTLKERLIDILKFDKRDDILNSVTVFSSIRRMGEIVAIASEKASHVIGALRNYLKQDADGKYAEVNISGEIETILTLLHGRIKHGVILKKNYLTDDRVFGERDKLNQIWINLLNNSLQAIDYHGTVEIIVEKRGEWIVVTVADSGPGIIDSIRDRIFEPFFTTKKHGEGMGLGLDISRKIAERHGGRIEFDSVPGRTEFRVFLPCKTH